MSNTLELSKRAMLINVNIRLEGLLGERRDRAASEMVSNAYSANAKRTKTSKYLIDRQHAKVKAVVASAQRVRDTVYRFTFPWGGTNMRLLPVKAHDDFQSAVNADLAQLKESQTEYLRAYPSLVEESKRNRIGLGALFDAAQYPSVETVKSMFHANVEYWPIPDSGHFIADIAQEAVDDARKQIIAANVTRANHAINDMIARVEKTVSEYVDKVAQYKKTDTGIIGIFRDSLVGNVEELAKLIRSLNFSDDAGIDVLANQVGRLARVTADSLRENADLRTNMVNEGRSLLATLDSYRKIESAVDDMIGEVRDYY